MKLINRGVVIIKPNELFLNWLNHISTGETEPVSFSLEEIQKDCTAFFNSRPRQCRFTGLCFRTDENQHF